MPSTATGRTYDTIHLATSSRPSRMLVAAYAGDTIDRTMIPLIFEPGVTDDAGYTAEQKLAGAPKSVTREPGKTKDVEQPEEEVTDERHYIDVQVPGARVSSRILVTPVGHAKPTDEHIERMKAIYNPQVARNRMDEYEGRAGKPKADPAKKAAKKTTKTAR